MKKPLDFFKTHPSLLDEPEVQQLLTYCESLEDELVDFKFEKSNNKELIMLDMLKEVVKSCAEIQKLEMEHKRFSYPLPDYSESIRNLKSYLLEMNRNNKLGL